MGLKQILEVLIKDVMNDRTGEMVCHLFLYRTLCAVSNKFHDMQNTRFDKCVSQDGVVLHEQMNKAIRIKGPHSILLEGSLN